LGLSEHVAMPKREMSSTTSHKIKFVDVGNGWGWRNNGTYRPRDDESGEEVPDTIERRGDDRRDMVARRQAHSHHAIECEIEKGEVHEEEVPEEFGNCPFEPNHRVHYDPVYGGLSQSVWEFNGNLYIYIYTTEVLAMSLVVSHR